MCVRVCACERVCAHARVVVLLLVYTAVLIHANPLFLLPCGTAAPLLPCCHDVNVQCSSQAPQPAEQSPSLYLKRKTKTKKCGNVFTHVLINAHLIVLCAIPHQRTRAVTVGQPITLQPRWFAVIYKQRTAKLPGGEMILPRDTIIDGEAFGRLPLHFRNVCL